MCPSFQATQAEMHSTRGRAAKPPPRWMIPPAETSRRQTGRGAAPEAAEKAAFEALDLCLACKGCKAECPSGVDVAKLKYEFMHAYYQRPALAKLRDYLFGYIPPRDRSADTIAWPRWPTHSCAAPGFASCSKRGRACRLSANLP